jgi:hypothetical protein
MSEREGDQPNTPALLTPTSSPNLASIPGAAMLGTWLLGGIAIGKDTSGNLAFAPEGVHNIAARKQAPNPDNDTFWVAKEESHGELRLVDVTPLVRPSSDFIVRVPVRARNVKPGDVLILCDNPFQALFVQRVEHDGRTIVGLDLQSNVTFHVPSQQLLSHDTRLLVKAISILDLDLFKRGHGGGPGGDGGIGSELLALSLLGSGAAGSPSAGVSGGQGAIDFNTLLLLAATEDDGGADLEEILPFLLLGNQSGDWSKVILLLKLLRRRNRRRPDSSEASEA